MRFYRERYSSSFTYSRLRRRIKQSFRAAPVMSFKRRNPPYDTGSGSPLGVLHPEAPGCSPSARVYVTPHLASDVLTLLCRGGPLHLDIHEIVRCERRRNALGTPWFTECEMQRRSDRRDRRSRSRQTSSITTWQSCPTVTCGLAKCAATNCETGRHGGIAMTRTVTPVPLLLTTTLFPIPVLADTLADRVEFASGEARGVRTIVKSGNRR
jgi:hypothetical protein